MMNNKQRTISLGLNGKINSIICNSVISHLSHGIWGNSQRMEKFWKFAIIENVGNNIVIKISNKNGELNTSYCTSCARYIENGFYNMTDKQIVDWFAERIRTIANTEIRDINNIVDIDFNLKKKFEFSTSCEEKTEYLDDGKVEITFADVRRAYDQIAATAKNL